MLRAGFLVVVCLLGGADAIAASTSTAIALDYSVGRQSAERFEITLRFRGDASGRTTLHIPQQSGDAQHAERGIEGLEAITPSARVEDTGDDHLKVVVHRPGEMLAVRYRLVQILAGEPDLGWPTRYLPVIQPNYFEWIGETAWVVPTDDDRRVHVGLHFDGLPDAWNFASSFGSDRHALAFVGTTHEFLKSIYVGGDFRLRSRAIFGGQLVVAVRGEWPFRDGELADRMATIADGERTFWNDSTQRSFLVTVLPLKSEAGRRAFEGTGLTQSFAIWLAGLRSLDQLDFLLTHEYFHSWNARALGKMPSPPALGYWFSEGFTEYYAHKLRLRWHMMTLEQYVDEFDKVLRALAELPENHLPNAAIGPRFFTEPRTIGKLPYWRGMLLAARWDSEIHAASGGRHSLDDAMRALHRTDPDRSASLTPDRIARIMRGYGVQDPLGDIERLIDRGQTIELREGTLTPCVAIERVAETTPAGGPIDRQRASVRPGIDARTRARCLADLGVRPAEQGAAIRNPSTGGPPPRS